MTRAIAGSASLFTLLLAACGGNVAVDPDGSGGAGGSTSTTPTTSTGVGGAGGGDQCDRGTGYFHFTLETWDGQTIGCSTSQPGSSVAYSLQGAVVEVSEGAIVIDSCPPNADCAAQLSTLRFEHSEPSLPPIDSSGTFVDLRIEVDHPFGCGQKLLVLNLPEWGGVPSTSWPTTSFWLAVGDGSSAPAQFAPFMIEGVPRGCYPDEDLGPCGKSETYALWFRRANMPDDPGVTVDNGMSAIWQVPDQGHTNLWLVSNQRAYETGICDDYWNWSWYVAYTPPPH